MSDSQSNDVDLHDRFTDRVFAEALGAERPPDLSAAILDKLGSAKASRAHTSKRPSRRSLALLSGFAVAASLVGVVLTLPAVRPARLAVRIVADEAHAVRDEKVAAPGPSNTGSDYEASSSRQPPSQESGDDRSASEPIRFVGDYGTSDSLLSSSTPEGVAVGGAESQATAGSPAQNSSTSQEAERQKTLLLGAYARQQGASSPKDQGYWRSWSAIEKKGLEPATPPATTVTDDFSVPFREERFGQQPQLLAAVGGARPSAPLSSNAIETEAIELRKHDAFGFYRQEHKRWPEARSGDRYEPIHENAFIKPVGEDALSTFSVDVDTASYANVRQHLLDMRRLPPADAVRVEELVNYFEYGYEPPEESSGAPFAASLGCSACPWKPDHKLVRIGVKGREVDADKRPLSNLVFLVDVSGSMNDRNKLPLVVEGLKALTDRLGENDRVAIVVYAGSEGVVLPSTSGDHKDEIRSALGRLQAGGSTAGGAGLKLAYEIAERNKIVGGVNRVVLCTDGDFNVGVTGTEELAQLVETRAKETGVFLTVLGFGRGNLNDAMLEAISGRGDGHYAYIDNEREARRVLSRNLSGTLVTIAKDVKLQVEFNPAKVASYRLIGYENRVMAAKDFNDDTKDAGEIGAGHTVTALYEVVPVGVEEPAPTVDGLKYQTAAVEDDAARDAPVDIRVMADSDELLTLKVRYKRPEGGASTKLEFPLEDAGKSLSDADADTRWAAAVAEFGMLLRNSRYVGDGSFDAVLELARGALGDDPHGYRAEFLDLVRRAQELRGQ